MFDFTGRAAVVTGAGAGIGAATARCLHESGARVVLADISQDALQSVISTMQVSDGSAITMRYDCTDSRQSEALVELCIEAFGRLDFAIACAGLHHTARLESIADDDWHRLRAVNYDGVFFLDRSAIRVMGEGSAIVNVASIAGHRGGTVEHTHYGATKGGVLALTRGLAREVWPTIRVNAVSPGPIDTSMMAGWLDKQEGENKLVAGVDYGLPSQVASVIAFLCSDAASFVSGESVVVAGTHFTA